MNKENSAHNGNAPSLQTRDERVTQVLKIFDRIAKDDFKPYEYAKSYLFPFKVDERFLEKFNLSSCEFSQGLNFGPMDFEAKTRFQDLTVLKHDDFHTFIENAGDKKEPESIKLKWRTFGYSAEGAVNASKIELKFETEKKLDIDIGSPEEVKISKIEISISGSDEKWVKASFHELVSFIPNVEVSSWLKMLLVFRNRYWVTSLSIFGAIFCNAVANDLYNLIYFEELNAERAKTLDELVKIDDLAEKMNAFFDYILGRERPLWYEGYGRMFMSLGTLGASFLVLLKMLPKLAPSSSIAIGLSNERAKERENRYKFFIVTLLILGFLIPAIRDFVGTWLSN